MLPNNSLWSTDRAEFAERVAKLAGGTTYRTPAAGRGTDIKPLPDEHAIAAALAYAKRGPQDIGPDVAYCWVLGTDAYRSKVTRQLAGALRCHNLRHVRAHLLAAAEAAWDTVVHDRRGAGSPPAGADPKGWDRALLAAIGTLHQSAWDSLAEAERRYSRAA